MKLREVSDVIAFDYRGTGLSNEIPPCESDEISLNRAYSYQDYVEFMSTNFSKCVEFWESKSIDTGSYNVLEVVEDLENLRGVLGAKKINLWGISWGTHVAFAYIKKYEQSVDRMILASLEGPNETIKNPEYMDRFLRRMDSLYSIQYPKKQRLLDLMDSAHTELSENPVVSEISGSQIAISKFDIQLMKRQDFPSSLAF